VGDAPEIDNRVLTPWIAVAIGAGGLLVGLVVVFMGSGTRGVFGAFIWFGLCGLVLMVGLAQIRMSRALRRLSRRTAAPSRPPRSRAAGWTPPPTLEVHEVGADATPRVPIPDGVAILMLWVFDHAMTGSLLFRLNQIGPVYFLRGGGALAMNVEDLPRMAFGRIDRMIEETEREVLDRLQRFRVKKRLGHYGLCSMVCTDSIWTFALDRMLERSRVVVVDLSDFETGRSGIAYELGLLFDRVRLDQVVFVTGPETDRAGLRELMREVWDTLAPESPNRRDGPVVATVASTTALVESNGADKQFSEGTKRDRELVAALVARAAATAPPRPLPPPSVPS
jgi:hypothetical protein